MNKGAPFCLVSLNAAEDQKLTHAQFRTLAVICGYADRKGFCWPSNTALAENLNISVRALQLHLSKLVKFGYLRREPRFRGDGSQTSNGYRIWPFFLGHDDSSAGESDHRTRDDDAIHPNELDQSKKEESENSDSQTPAGIHIHPPSIKSGITVPMIAQMVRDYGVFLPQSQAIAEMGPTRVRQCGHLLKFLKHDHDQWIALLARCAASDFLSARVKLRDGGTFRVDLDFILRSYVKIIEGKYDNRQGGSDDPFANLR